MMTGSSWHCYANAIQNPQTTKPWHSGQDGWGSVVVPLRRGQTCRANSTPTDQHNSSICYHGDVFMSCSNSEAWTPGHDWEELLSSSPLPPPLSGGIKNFVIWYRTVSKKHSVNSNVLNHLSTSLYLPLILQLKQNKQQLDETLHDVKHYVRYGFHCTSCLETKPGPLFDPNEVSEFSPPPSMLHLSPHA